jgi:hypothetical protein
VPKSIKDRSLGPVNKFSYVLVHMVFMGSRKLSSFNGR